MKSLHSSWTTDTRTVLSELESCTFRNRTPEETQAYILPLLEKHLPLHSNSSRSSTLQEERKRDHYSHFILRLAFSATEDLRRRFSRLETQLFRLRWQADDGRERREFVESLGLDWEKVSEAEKAELEGDLKAASGFAGRRAGEEEGWFKVDWEKVPELVERRQCLVRRGKAYVPVREQMSLVLAEFTRRLDDALEVSFAHVPKPCAVLISGVIVNRPRPPSSRRRRPPHAHSKPPVPILHRPRHTILIQRQSLLSRRSQRLLHRRPLRTLPALHAHAALHTARKQPPQTLRPSAIHALPQRPGFEFGRLHTILAEVIQVDDR